MCGLLSDKVTTNMPEKTKLSYQNTNKIKTRIVHFMKLVAIDQIQM